MTTASPGERPEAGLPHLEAANEAFIQREQERRDIPADTFANRLILSRVHAGWLTVKEAAERCGLNYGSWSNWERGARPRDLLDVVGKVAEGLRIDEEWLLFGGPLLGAKGREVRRHAKKGRGVNTTWYAGQTSGLPSGDGRVTGGRPKGRNDVTRPPASSASPAVQDGRSRRPVRINPVLAADQVDVLINRA